MGNRGNIVRLRVCTPHLYIWLHVRLTVDFLYLHRNMYFNTNWGWVAFTIHYITSTCSLIWLVCNLWLLENVSRHYWALYQENSPFELFFITVVSLDLIKSVCLISFLFLWLKQLSAYRYRQTINYFWLWLRADLIENDKIHFTESELLHENFGFLFQFTEKFVILFHSVREIISCYAELKHVAKPNMLFMNLSSSFSLSVTFNDKYTHIENSISMHFMVNPVDCSIHVFYGGTR